MSALPLLFTYRRCPYAMRARMALLQAGVAYEAFEIVLRDKPAVMLAASPKGTVPVLVLPDGTVWEQSLDIVRWAFAQAGDVQGWWARSQSDANAALQAACDGAFKHHLDRTKYPERFSDAQGREWHREKALQVLSSRWNTGCKPPHNSVATPPAPPTSASSPSCANSPPPTRRGGPHSRSRRCRRGWLSG